MINPQELRIGNRIFNGIVTEIRKDYFIFNDGFADWSSKGFANDTLLPIPITPEILEQCDFEKCESDDVEERDIYTIQVDNNHSLYFDPTEDPQWYISLQWNNNHYKNSFWAQPEYLHQLQNLIHSLTNQELTFKTTTHD